MSASDMCCSLIASFSPPSTPFTSSISSSLSSSFEKDCRFGSVFSDDIGYDFVPIYVSGQLHDALTRYSSITEEVLTVFGISVDCSWTYASYFHSPHESSSILLLRKKTPISPPPPLPLSPALDVVELSSSRKHLNTVQ